MRFAVFALLLVFCVNSFAGNVKATLSKEENVSARILKAEDDSQARLKKSYLQSKKDYLYRAAQIASKAGVVEHSKATECANDQAGVFDRAKCRIKEISIRSSQGFYQSGASLSKTIKHTQSWVGNVWNGLKDTYRKISRTFVKFDNQLPEADGMFFERRSQGASPLYAFSTNEEMTDPDGSIDHVVYDFGHGLPISIPANEISPYADIDHVFPAPGTYDVSLKIYDDQNEFTEYTQTINVVNETVPLNDFSYSVTSGTTVDFSGVASSATSFTKYRWNMGDGTGNFTGTTLTSITHTFNSPGEYQVTFQAWDDKDARARITKTIYVGVATPSEAPPYAILKMDKVFEQGPMTVNFDASFSVDQAGNPAAYYQWDFGDFDSIANYATGATSSHTYKRPGTYFGLVRVFDSNNNMTEKTFRVFVSTGSVEAPMIQARQTWTYRDIAFDVSSWGMSSTSDPSTFIWNFGDGNIESGMTDVQHQYSTDGTYTVQITAIDVQGVRHVVSKSITVANDFDIPDVRMDYADVQNRNQPSTYYSSGSYDPLNGVLTYTWNFGDGTILSGTEYDTPIHTYTRAGVYSIRLTVTNERGLSQSQYGSVTVQDGSYLKAEITYDPKTGIAPLAVNFSSAMSVANLSPIVKQVWQFADNRGSDQPTTSKTFGSPGLYWVKLYVQDALGNESVSYKEITVINGGEIPRNNQPPTASFSECFDGPSGQKVSFDASNSRDLDGGIRYYEWNIDGIEQPDGVKMVYYFSPGTHTVKLTVIDVWGAKHSISKTFKIGTSSTPVIGFNFNPDPILEDVATSFGPIANILVPLLPLNEYVYEWDFGDGSAKVNGENVSHTYTNPGEYKVTMAIPLRNGIRLVHRRLVLVGAVEVPQIRISANSGANKVDLGKVLELDALPSSVDFSIGNSTISGIQDAIWDFGDGNTGYGRTPTWTYSKPGNYTVTVTAIDSNGVAIGTSSIEVLVKDASCVVADGYNGCINPSLNSNIFSLSSPMWGISHDQGEKTFSLAPSDISWVVLEEIKGEDPDVPPIAVPIGDIVTISGKELHVNKSGLVAKNVDLTKSYKLKVTSALEDGSSSSPYYAESQEIFFGIGKFDITTTEPGVRIFIKSSKSGFKKYLLMANDLTKSLQDLPVGKYIIFAEKDDRSFVYITDIFSSTPVSINIDLSAANIEKMSQIERTAGKSKNRNPMSRNARRFGKLDSKAGMDAYPDQCGNNLMIKRNDPRTVPNGIYSKPFGVDPNESPDLQYFQVSAKYGPKIKVACVIRTLETEYTLRKWQSIGSFGKCWATSDPFSQDDMKQGWLDYLNAIQVPGYSSPYVVTYKIKDQATSRVVTGYFSSSAPEGRADLKTDWDDLTRKVGHWAWGGGPGISVEHGYFKEVEIQVPNDFVDPYFMATIKGYDEDSYGYSVYCGIEERTNMGNAFVEGFEPDDRPRKPFTIPRTSDDPDAPRYDAKANGLRLAKYKQLPLDADLSANGPKEGPDGKPEIYMATFKVIVNTGTLSPSEIQKIQIDYTYNGHTEPVLYKLEDKKIEGPKEVSGYIKLDVQKQLDGKFTFNPLESKVIIRIRPITPTGLGEGISKDLDAMFDVKKLDEDFQPCSLNFYSTRQISAYAKPEMIGRMNNFRLATQRGFRCNDFSLPWGGEFALSSTWAHQGHKFGTTADVRYANTSGGAADDYDGNDAALRVSDVNNYLYFSSEAYKISNSSESKYQGMKSELMNYCIINPTKSPCTAITTSSDITHDFVLNLCQWQQNVSPIIGCPETAIKNYLESISRFSRWLELNIEHLRLLGMNFSFIISDGSEVNLVDYGNTLEGPFWQASAFERGRWPDGTVIYKSNSSGDILQTKICASTDISCSTGIRTSTIKKHLNHTHIDL